MATGAASVAMRAVVATTANVAAVAARRRAAGGARMMSLWWRRDGCGWPAPTAARFHAAAGAQQGAETARVDSSLAAPAAGSMHGKHWEALQAGMVEEVDNQKVEIVFTLQDRPGGLGDALAVFQQHKLNLSHIDSRPTKTFRDGRKAFQFRIDVDAKPGDARVGDVMHDLKRMVDGVDLATPRMVPWFPTVISDIDHFSTKTLDAGAELEADHPGFHDAEYRERRRMIVHNASTFKHGEKIPRVAYTKEETATWGLVYNKLRGYTRQFGVDQYNHVLPLLEQHCGYSETNIPQLQDISDFLQTQTGFTLRPVGGLLSARDFLNGLAYRVFFSTQYIRHHTKPLYTPEPDICHELMGHAPMFADPDFADFSHEIGLASLGASDEEIKKLATVYWFSVEFGLCMQGGQRKAYGAGLLSSFGELEYACAPYRPAGGESTFPEYRPWEPEKAAVTAYPITRYQPVYFVADSMTDAKVKVRTYCESLNKGFNVTYDANNGRVTVDRAIVRGKYTVTLQT